MTQYKFLSADLISINGFTYTIGEWTPPVDPKIGVSGYHVIVRERLIFWCSGIAPRLFEVETRGACDGPDRLGRSARQSVRLAREITGWNDRTARLLAVRIARDGLFMLGYSDPRSVAAIDIAERFANGKATEKELAAFPHPVSEGGGAAATIYSKSWVAARTAAAFAAYDAIGGDTREASEKIAWKKYNQWFIEAVGLDGAK